MAKTTKTAAPKTTSPKASTAGVATATKAAPAKTVTVQATPAPAPAKSSSTCCGGSTCATPTYEQIAQKAFEIWVAKGRPQGRDVENWKQAEAELMKGSLVTAA